MTTRMLTERAVNLGDFRRAIAGQRLPFTPVQIAHVYLKLDFKPQYERARSAEDARGFLRSVARAAMAADQLASLHNGHLLEVQGSLLHIGIPLGQQRDWPERTAGARSFAASIHIALEQLFGGEHARVEGWRATIDGGKTLVVAGRGVHDDFSFVSLGSAANRPAKHLYAQLELAEDRRELKRFMVGYRDPRSERWYHEPLASLPVKLQESKAVGDAVRSLELRMRFDNFIKPQEKGLARAVPLAPAGSPNSPSADKPHTYFGWVMRADLDGFTRRVDECIEDDIKLQRLAVGFYAMMDAAASFTDVHSESLIQLPWAGDNFTAAAVFSTKAAYDAAVSKRLVELSLDFEKEMAAIALENGFGGWAYGVAGGEVNGNVLGNVYLAGIEVGDKRFLVGAGEGFGRSAQAFADINPKVGSLAVFTADWQRLAEAYKAEFVPAINSHGERSSLYYSSSVSALKIKRVRAATVAPVTVVTASRHTPQEVVAKPYCP